MNPALAIDGLSISYATRGVVIDAVCDLSLSVAPGERLGLVGESGSGKTTTALAIMGMLRPPGRVTSGSIRLDGTELVGLDAETHRHLRLSRVSYVPQGAMNSLNPVLRVRQSIGDAIRAHQRVPADALRNRIAKLLADVGLSPEIAERYPHELSGGMKQRVCIALAISLGPRIIIADEPTSALDVVTQRQVIRTLHEAQERLGSAMLLIGHDMALMAQSVHRVAVMRHGRLEDLGDTRRVFRSPRGAYTTELIRNVPMLDDPNVARTGPGASALAPSVAPALLRFDGVSKTYGGGLFARKSVTALHTLDLHLPTDQPRIVAIVGQSGSGKTTLGALTLGFAAPSSGRVLYDGDDVASLRGAARRRFRRDVQAVFQDPYSTFNPFYRVRRSLALPLRSFGIARGANAREMMAASCRQVGLDPAQLLDRFPHELSGGQRQRLMVARALMLRPRLLVADEPVSMVDASVRASILDLLTDLRDLHRISILYITHDLATAYRVADEVLVLHKGRVVEAGGPGPVLRRPRHPYTRLLVDSLPWPDPDRPWGDMAAAPGLLREIEAMAPGPTILRNDTEIAEPKLPAELIE